MLEESISNREKMKFVEAYTGLNVETELLDKDIAVGSHDWDTVESDIFRFYDFPATLEVFETIRKMLAGENIWRTY